MCVSLCVCVSVCVSLWPKPGPPKGLGCARESVMVV